MTHVYALPNMETGSRLTRVPLSKAHSISFSASRMCAGGSFGVPAREVPLRTCQASHREDQGLPAQCNM